MSRYFLLLIGMSLHFTLKSQETPINFDDYFSGLAKEIKDQHPKDVFIIDNMYSYSFSVFELDEYVSAEKTFESYLSYLKQKTKSFESSDLEVSFMVGRNLFSQFGEPDLSNGDLIVKVYEDFMVGYLSFLLSEGIDFYKTSKSKRFIKAKLFSNIYDLSTFDLLYLYDATVVDPQDIGYPVTLSYDYPDPSPIGFEYGNELSSFLLNSRLAVLKAFERVGISIDEAEIKKKKYNQSLRKGLIAQCIENDGIKENLDLLAYLLEGQDINMLKIEGLNIFTYSVTGSFSPMLNPEFYQLYLDKNFNVNLECDVCNGLPPLSIIAGITADGESFLELLRSKQYQKDKRMYEASNKLLFIDSKYELFEIGNKLLKAGANVNQPDDSGRTPLHWAVIQGNYNWVGYLVENGANKQLTDFDNKTPMDYANEMLALSRQEDVMFQIEQIIYFLK